MIKNMPKQRLQEIVDFIKDNYEAPDYLIPESVEDLIEKHGRSEVFMLEDLHGIEALSFFKLITPNLWANSCSAESRISCVCAIYKIRFAFTL